MPEFGEDFQSAVRMFCDRCARVARRFVGKLDGKSRGFRRKKSAQIAAEHAPDEWHKRQNNDLMVSEISLAMKMHWRRFDEPCVRVAREYSQCGNSPKSALRRRSPKNRAHFRRAPHRTITKCITINFGIHFSTQ